MLDSNVMHFKWKIKKKSSCAYKFVFYLFENVFHSFFSSFREGLHISRSRKQKWQHWNFVCSDFLLNLCSFFSIFCIFCICYCFWCSVYSKSDSIYGEYLFYKNAKQTQLNEISQPERNVQYKEKMYACFCIYITKIVKEREEKVSKEKGKRKKKQIYRIYYLVQLNSTFLEVKSIE